MRIQRSTATRLVVSSSIEGVRQLDFASIGDLLDFQVNYESNLAKDGWTLVEFQPERRTQPDRRKIPRFGEDRRRRPAPTKLP